MANALIQNPVDRENHIVHGVKVLGFTSANGRIYDFAAVKEAIAKYEKAPVNKDHNMEEPSFSDRLGWLENVTLEKDGLYADFHYNPHAEGIESFLWFAEHNGLGDVGFSHLVSGKYSVDPDGTERITRIDKVRSVDLVANPATTKTIFEQEDKPMGKKITKEAGNAANKAKKNELDREKGAAALKDIRDKRSYADKVKYQPSVDYQLSGKQKKDEISLGRGIRKFKQEDDDVGEAYKDQPNDPYDLGVFLRKQGVKKPDNPFGDGIGTGKTWNSDQFDRGFSGRPRAIFKTKPGDPGEQEGDDEMDKDKMMEDENPMTEYRDEDRKEREFERAVDALDRRLMKDDNFHQEEYDKEYKALAKKMKDKKYGEAEQDPMMDEADDVYAKVKEVCEGEGSDEEKSKMVLEMLGLSGGMSEAEYEPMEEADDEEMKEEDDDEMKEDDDEDPRKESKSELKSLRKWKSEKLKEEKIVNLIKESNLEPTRVFVKQLSAIDSKLWSEAIRDRRKVALTRSSVKPISSGSQSRSESSYKQFLESVLGK